MATCWSRRGLTLDGACSSPEIGISRGSPARGARTSQPRFPARQILRVLASGTPTGVRCYAPLPNGRLRRDGSRLPARAQSRYLTGGPTPVSSGSPARRLRGPAAPSAIRDPNAGVEALEGYLEMEGRLLSHEQSRQHERATGYLELLAELFVVLLVLPALVVLIVTVIGVLAPGLADPVAIAAGRDDRPSPRDFGSAALVTAPGCWRLVVARSARGTRPPRATACRTAPSRYSRRFRRTLRARFSPARRWVRSSRQASGHWATGRSTSRSSRMPPSASPSVGRSAGPEQTPRGPGVGTSFTRWPATMRWAARFPKRSDVSQTMWNSVRSLAMFSHSRSRSRSVIAPVTPRPTAVPRHWTVRRPRRHADG